MNVSNLYMQASDVINLKLRDIDWRRRSISIIQEKTKTPLAEEFAQSEEDTVSVEDINVSVESDLAAEDEAVTVKQTYPDDSEACADLIDDSDIK